MEKDKEILTLQIELVDAKTQYEITTIRKETNESRLRTVIIKGEPWFLGTDIGTCLGYANPRRAYLDHTEEKYRKALFYKGRPDSGLPELWSENDFREKIVISEAGLFQMIFESQTELAAAFRDWVYEEVLPSIRKNGGYIAGQEDLDPSDRLKLNEKIKELSADVSRLQKRRHEILAENRELKANKPEFIRLEYFG